MAKRSTKSNPGNKRSRRHGSRKVFKCGAPKAGKHQKPGGQKQPPLNTITVSLDHARRLFMVTKRVKGSAQSTGVSEWQLRRLIQKYKLAKWDPKTRRWRITDRARREVGIIADGS